MLIFHRQHFLIFSLFIGISVHLFGQNLQSQSTPHSIKQSSVIQNQIIAEGLFSFANHYYYNNASDYALRNDLNLGIRFWYSPVHYFFIQNTFNFSFYSLFNNSYLPSNAKPFFPTQSIRQNVLDYSFSIGTYIFTSVQNQMYLSFDFGFLTLFEPQISSDTVESTLNKTTIEPLIGFSIGDRFMMFQNVTLNLELFSNYLFGKTYSWIGEPQLNRKQFMIGLKFGMGFYHLF